MTKYSFPVLTVERSISDQEIGLGLKTKFGQGRLRRSSSSFMWCLSGLGIVVLTGCHTGTVLTLNCSACGSLYSH